PGAASPFRRWWARSTRGAGRRTCRPPSASSCCGPRRTPRLLRLNRRRRPDPAHAGRRAGLRTQAVGVGLLLRPTLRLFGAAAGRVLGRAPEAVHVAALALARALAGVGLEGL